MRAFPWAQRADILEAMMSGSIDSVIAEIPDMTRHELLTYLFLGYRTLVEQIDDGDIESLDHAALLMTFAPSRAPTAARWLYENIADDVGEQWWESHPLLTVFNQIAQYNQSIALH